MISGFGLLDLGVRVGFGSSVGVWGWARLRLGFGTELGFHGGDLGDGGWFGTVWFDLRVRVGFGG